MNTRAANSYTTTFGYVAGGHGTKSTTPLVASISQPGMNFSYTYDNRGNIISETRNGVTTTYEYDGLGQLTRVNDPSEGGTWVYTYDRGGNLTNQSRYQYSTGALGTLYASYDCDYDDANWKDKITAQNGYPITYDAIGNPTNDSNWNYTWSAGRQLVKMSKTNHTINFKYNHNGLRTQKAVTINGVTTTTNYTYHGKLVTHMTRGSDNLHFFYDSASKPAFVKFNGTMYRYVHNLQGDIVGIIDSNNAIVVEYKYNAWGKPYSITGSMASTLGAVNPFLYRGYVYDTETGFYYLRSRYFATIYPKFINADSVLGMKPSIFDHNLYSYCFNNPIAFSDATGKYPGENGNKHSSFESNLKAYITYNDNRDRTGDIHIKLYYEKFIEDFNWGVFSKNEISIASKVITNNLSRSYGLELDDKDFGRLRGEIACHIALYHSGLFLTDTSRAGAFFIKKGKEIDLNVMSNGIVHDNRLGADFISDCVELLF